MTASFNTGTSHSYMSAKKMTLTDQKFHYTSDDFKSKCIENEEDKHGLSKVKSISCKYHLLVGDNVINV